MTPREAFSAGARSMVIGVVNPGGFIPDAWIAPLVEAMEAGLDIVSGMHGQLAVRAELAEAATRFGCRLIDRAIAPEGYSLGHRAATRWPAPAHRRNRLRALQEKYGARADPCIP
jgi:uncharacterized NAD-dependent epimerase/dehydratase family protein